MKPGHFKQVFFPAFFSIQNPAMNKIINIKINSSSQWDCLSSDGTTSCALTPVPGVEALVIGNVVMIFVVVDKVGKDDIAVVTFTHSLSFLSVPSLIIIIPG